MQRALRSYVSVFLRDFTISILSILPTVAFFGAMLWLMGSTWQDIGWFSTFVSVLCIPALAFRSHRIATGRIPHIEDLFTKSPDQFRFEPPPAPDWPTDLDFSEVQVTRASRVSASTAALALAAAMFVLVATTVIGLVALMAAGFLGHKAYVARKRAVLSSHSLSVTSDTIAEIDTDKRVLSTIDLSRPFCYVYLDKEEGAAIYRVIQDRERVEFLSTIPGADVVAKGVLRAEWPPRDRARPGPRCSEPPGAESSWRRVPPDHSYINTKDGRRPSVPRTA